MSSSVAAKPTRIVVLLGYAFLFLGVIILSRLYWEPLKQETRYTLSRVGDTPTRALEPVNTDFALVIDKIGATAPVVANVNPLDSGIYQRALTRGVAHADGTSLPGEGGNIFLFAHSSANPTDAARFNSVFYLIHHLVPGDEIKVWYREREFVYIVSETQTVSPDRVEYLSPLTNGEQLTIMTCWPPGTTLRRLVVVAKPRQL